MRFIILLLPLFISNVVINGLMAAMGIGININTLLSRKHYAVLHLRRRLQKIYEERGIVPSQEVIAYCQVGMRASVDLFALHLIGYDKLRNYYGAWEEWGNRDDLPLATKK